MRRAPAALTAGLVCLAAILPAGAAHGAVTFDCDFGVPAATLQLFDGHDHLRVPSEAEAEANLAALAGEGVSAGMLALGTPDSGDLAISLALQGTSPRAVFAFVNPPAVLDGTGEKIFDATTLAYVQTQLTAGAWGIGEISLRHSGPPALGANIAADAPGAMALYAEAAARGVPVTIHFETRDKSAPGVDVASRIEELRVALGANPNTVFIWAHLGDTGPATVRALIEEFPNLYADISTRNPYFVRGWPASLQSLGDGPLGLGSLKTEWKSLFEDHSARFLFGLDLASSVRWDQLPEVMVFYRSMLGELPQAAAEKIGCANAHTLLAAAAVPGPGAPGIGVLVLGMSALGFIALKRGRLFA
jgi:predicted TIM-barrel fold metal-dependent hydrolase